MNIRKKIQYAHFATSHALQTFKSDIKGLSGVEFALIAPMLIGIYLGVAETALGVTNSRKVSRVAATLSDLVAQSETMTGTTVDNIMNASSAVMAPYTATPLKIHVIGVQIDGDGAATVVWSRKKGNTSAPQPGSSYPIPDDIRLPNTFLVVSKVTYEYAPSLGANLIDTFYFNETNYNVPRTSSTIGFTN